MLTVMSTANTPSRKEYAYKMKGFNGINMRDSENIMPLEESPNAKNVSFAGGDLHKIKGFGIVRWIVDGSTAYTLAQLPEAVTGLFEFQSSETVEDNQGYKNFYYSDTSGGLYRFLYNSTNSRVEASLIVPTGTDEMKPITYFTQFKNGSSNCAVLGGPECGPYVYTDGGTYSLITTQTKPHMSHTVLHYGRLFGIGDATYPQRIWFSKLNSPTDFESSLTGGGYIDISDFIGDAVGILSYYETLYVFCRYGIVALDTLSEQNEFSLEVVYRSDTEIIPGTMCACGNKILFATRYGIFSFNGSTAKCISAALSEFFAKGCVRIQDESSLYFNGTYMASYHKTDNTKGILYYSIEKGTWEIYEGVSIKAIAVMRDNMSEKIICALGSSGVLMEMFAGVYLSTSGTIQSIWESPFNDFGDSVTKKYINEIHFSATGNGNIQLIVTGDSETQTRTITLTSTKTAYRIPFSVSGNNIKITIKNVYGSDFTLSPLTVVYTCERQYPMA